MLTASSYPTDNFQYNSLNTRENSSWHHHVFSPSIPRDEQLPVKLSVSQSVWPRICKNLTEKICNFQSTMKGTFKETMNKIDCTLLNLIWSVNLAVSLSLLLAKQVWNHVKWYTSLHMWCSLCNSYCRYMYCWYNTDHVWSGDFSLI